MHANSAHWCLFPCAHYPSKCLDDLLLVINFLSQWLFSCTHRLIGLVGAFQSVLSTWGPQLQKSRHKCAQNTRKMTKYTPKMTKIQPKSPNKHTPNLVKLRARPHAPFNPIGLIPAGRATKTDSIKNARWKLKVEGSKLSRPLELILSCVVSCCEHVFSLYVFIFYFCAQQQPEVKQTTLQQITNKINKYGFGWIKLIRCEEEEEDNNNAWIPDQALCNAGSGR